MIMNYDEIYFVQFKSEKVEMSRAAMAVCLQRKMFSYSEHMSLLQLHIYLSLLCYAGGVLLRRWRGRWGNHIS